MRLPVRMWEISSVLVAMIVAGAGVAALVLLIPILAIYLYHRRKMDEIRARQRVQVAEETREAIAALRQEIEALRDTTTQYDISFDTALRRLDSSVSGLQQRLQHVESEMQVGQARSTQGGDR